MLRIYDCVVRDHEPRLLILTLLLCFFAASTSVIMAKRATASGDHSRFRWLLAAGLVTGVGIWTNHFAAMQAFSPGFEIRFDAMYMFAALGCAIVFSIAGWTVGFTGEQSRPLVGGALIGIGLSGSHYLDSFGIRVPGYVSLETDLVVLSLLVGIPLCMLAAHLLARHKSAGFPISASIALATGIITLHLIAMAAVNLVADPRVEAPTSAISLDTIGGWVLASSLCILAAGLALAIYDHYSAAAIEEDRERLSETVEALIQSEENYRFALELNPQLPWTADADGSCLEIGPKWTEYFNLETQSALGVGWLSFVHPDDLPATEARWFGAIGSGRPFDARYRMRCGDGTFRWFRDRGRPRRKDDGTILKWYGSMEDIHDQVLAEEALRESEERYRLACQATNDVIWDWHHEEDRLHWGGAVFSNLGYSDAIKGTNFAWWVDRVHPDDRDIVLQSLNEALARNESHWSREYRFRRADGTYAHILSRGYTVTDANGRPVRSIGAMMDISELKKTELSLLWAAQHDALTDLPNRSLFRERLTSILAEAENNDDRVGLLFLDVDDFKLFNDTHGHDAGDKLLCWIARTLQQGVNNDAIVARLSGDEFAIILPHFLDEDPATALAGLSDPFCIEHEAINIRVSAGVAIWPQHARSTEDFLKCADLALYACKADKLAGLRIFRPEMRAAADTRATMLELASSALREERISAYYQPKVCLKTGTLAGMEALLRWQHPSDGLQSPASIAAAFDNAELAIKITDRILDCLLADVRKWLDLGLGFGRVAFNASAADFARGDFSRKLLSKLDGSGVAPHHLELEVTENVLLGRDAGRVSETLNELNRAGMSIALDDFGTGYASLSHLNSFPVDVLKIDRSFIRPLTGEQRSADEAIVRAIIGLARNMRILTVAEGIETAEQTKHLQKLKCDLGQGYLFSRPTSPDDVPRMLTRGLLQWPALVRHNPERHTSLGPCLSELSSS